MLPEEERETLPGEERDRETLPGEGRNSAGTENDCSVSGKLVFISSFHQRVRTELGRVRRKWEDWKITLRYNIVRKVIDSFEEGVRKLTWLEMSLQISPFFRLYSSRFKDRRLVAGLMSAPP